MTTKSTVEQVADTYENARYAAGKVNVGYDTQSVGAPIMTCDDAAAKNSVFPIAPMFLQSPVGDVEKVSRCASNDD